MSRAHAFDHHDPALATRIFEEYAELRAECPIGWSERHDGYWVVTSWAGIHDLAHDTANFSSRRGLIPPVLGDNVLIPIFLDPPEHSKYRTLLQRWFTTARMATFEGFIREKAGNLLAGLSSPADLATDFAGPLPLDVTLMVIGVPDHDMDVVAEGARATIEGVGSDSIALFEKIGAAYGYLAQELVPKLRAQPGDDLVSFLIGAEIDGEPMADMMIASIAFNVVGAGFDTTYKSLSSSLAFLATHPEEQRRLRAVTDLETAVEELLRLFAPVSAGRLVMHDVTYSGVDFKEGDQVLLAYPAAGRDPAMFDDPDSADFERRSNKHLAFGTGIHRCLGMHLARLELQVALEELFAAISWFELEPGREPAYSQSQVWGATSVPVTFERAQ
ncbi:MAG TPA: cytochrome P450 [Acidimicrobiia bacterium]|nr:cytochrome P450 [Acidimicrobiia bacterium]